MSHDEFFNTYFQRPERAGGAGGRDASRARGVSVARAAHEQLTIAQERIRERRNGLGHEVDGLETGLPPQSELEKERKVPRRG